jgi:predicted phage terminase large subunit-like protein
VDDPYGKIEDAESPTIREGVLTWFLNDIGSRLLPGAKVFVIMTRFHEEDLTGSLLELNKKLPKDSRYFHMEAPAICFDPSTDILRRNQGEVLWEYYNLQYFLEKRANSSYQRFSLIYQQLADASNPDNIASCIKFYDRAPHKTDAALSKAKANGQVDDLGRPKVNPRDYYRRLVVSVDCAAKKTERADYTVVQVWGEGYDHNHYLLDQARVKVEFPQMVQEIETKARKWEVDCILVEDKGQGTAYIQARGRSDSQRRLAPAEVIPISVPSNQGKEFRFDEITPLIETGNVHVPQNADWVDLFVREVGQFPDGAHDDQVDAMSQYLRWAKKQRSRYGSRKVGSMG